MTQPRTTLVVIDAQLAFLDPEFPRPHLRRRRRAGSVPALRPALSVHRRAPLDQTDLRTSVRNSVPAARRYDLDQRLAHVCVAGEHRLRVGVGNRLTPHNIVVSRTTTQAPVESARFRSAIEQQSGPHPSDYHRSVSIHDMHHRISSLNVENRSDVAFGITIIEALAGSRAGEHVPGPSVYLSSGGRGGRSSTPSASR